MSQLDLAHDYVTMRPYSVVFQQAVFKAADAWREFVALPTDDKLAASAEDLQFSSGYERKLGGERESRDIKENFDYTANTTEQLGGRALSATTRAFLEAANTLAAHVSRAIELFGAEIDVELGMTAFAKLAKQSAQNYFIRFIHYPPSPEGSVVGEARTDHSGFTFHLYESTGGCRMLSPDARQWQPLPVAQNEMAAFAGMQLQLATGGRVKALCHDIVANEEAAREGRIAIVCFTSLEGVPRYDRNTHGRLQDMPAGFNYTMTHDEFAHLFTS